MWVKTENTSEGCWGDCWALFSRLAAKTPEVWQSIILWHHLSKDRGVAEARSLVLPGAQLLVRHKHGLPSSFLSSKHTLSQNWVSYAQDFSG